MEDDSQKEGRITILTQYPPLKQIATKSQRLLQLRDPISPLLMGATDPIEAIEPEMYCWYQQQIRYMPSHCAECRARIETWNENTAIAAIAHILPKKLFLSVRKHPLNYLILGAECGCHRRYDKDWESAANMKVFSLAIEFFRLFYPDIAPEEQRLIPQCLLQHL